MFVGTKTQKSIIHKKKNNNFSLIANKHVHLNMVSLIKMWMFIGSFYFFDYTVTFNNILLHEGDLNYYMKVI